MPVVPHSRAGYKGEAVEAAGGDYDPWG